MAKELAQSVGGKKIAFLLAILAAFAVLATLGNRWDSTPARAIHGVTFSGADGGTADVLGPGDTVTYTLTGNTAAGEEPSTLTINVPAFADVNGSVWAGLPTVNCGAGGVASSTATTATCQYATAGNRTMTAAWTVKAQVEEGFDDNGVATGAASDNDAVIADRAVAITEPIRVLAPSLVWDKAVNTTIPCQAGTCTGVYTITITNNALSPEGDLDDLDFDDALDANLTIDAVDNASCTFTNNPPVVNCDDIDIAGGANAVVNVDFTVNAGIPTTPYQVINNIDTDDVSAANTTFAPGANLANVNFNVVGTRSLELYKWADPSSVTSNPVQEFTWVFQIVNTGTVDLQDIVLFDPQISGDGASAEPVPGQTWTGSLAGACSIGGAGVAATFTCNLNGAAGLDPLPSGASVTIQVRMRTIANATEKIVYNDATASAIGVPPVVNFGGTVAIDNDPILTISKTASSNAVGFAGTGPSTTFTVTVRNHGNVPANGVAIADTLPAGLSGNTAACNTTVNLAANDNAAGGADEFSCTIVANLTAGTTPANGSTFVNEATATYNGTTISAVESVSAAVPVITVEKTAVNGHITSANASETFNIVVRNVGSAPSGTIAITDTPGQFLTVNGLPIANIATLAAGASQTIQVTAQAAAAAPDGSILSNNVCVLQAAPIPSGDCDDATTQVRAPQLAIAIQPNKSPVSGNPQEQFGWILTVSNTGSLPANDITVNATNNTAAVYSFNTGATFTLGNATCTVTSATAFTCGSTLDLTAGSSVTAVIPSTVAAAAANGAVGTASASASCAACPSAVSASSNVNIQNQPVLSLVKNADSDPIVAGGFADYTLTITNSGGAAATVTLSDAMPAILTSITVTQNGGLTCNVNNTTKVVTCTGTVAAGATVTVKLRGTVPANTANGTVLINDATLVSPTIPQITLAAAAGNNIVAATLTAHKVNAPLIVPVNGVVTSTIVVTNNGNSTAQNVGIVDVLPLRATFVATGSTPSCSVTNTTGSGTGAGGTLQQTVTCTGGALAQGSSTTFTVRFNVGDPTAAPAQSAIRTNNVTTTNTSGFPNGTAQASVTVVAAVAGAGLVHVDVDAASESASHGLNATDPNQVLHNPGSSEANVALIDDIDDATGSLHTVCLISPDYGVNDQADIVWSILPTPGSSATVSPAGGTKSVLNIVDATYNDPQANCVSWRSAGVGGQTITASHAVTGQVFYAGATAATPLIKEWNDIDVTKIVKVVGNVGNTLFQNTQDLASWMGLATGGTCIRNADTDNPPPATSCLARANQDGTVHTLAGPTIVTGPRTGNIIAGNVSFIEYALGNHAGVQGTDYTGPIDGVKQTFTVSGTCGTVRVENPVTGTTSILSPGGSVTILNSDKGVGFQILSSDNGAHVTDISNADCSPGEWTRVTITSTEDVQLRSDVDTAPVEWVEVRWVTAPPPQKKILLAWAGQRVILEHDWRINAAGPNGRAYDVTSATIPADPAAGNICPVTLTGGNAFPVTYIRGTGPGNFLPSLGAQIQGNDHARVLVQTNIDQVNDDSNPQAGNLNCISRVLYESEDPGEVDIEAFIDFEDVDPNVTFYPVNYSKIAFVIYYMKFESIDLSIVSQASKTTHNGPSLIEPAEGNTTTLYDYADWSPGNPWDASLDDADDAVTWNVSKDLLLRGRVKGWTVSSNPSGRAAVNDPGGNNSRPANRWVLPDDWDLMAGGPHGEEVKGVAEETRPDYDLMIAPNNIGVGTGVPFLCATPWGGCSETLVVTLGADGVTVVSTTQTYDVVGPIEGPFSLLDLRGPLSAALSNAVPTTVRNTIVRDWDVDWWDAPMPAAVVTVDLRESGFLKQVRKADVYWTGRVNGHTGSVALGGQDYTNPFYFSNIPDSMHIPAVVAGGGFLWDSWGNDGAGGLGQGAYEFWTALPQFLGWSLGTDVRSVNTNPLGGYDSTVTLPQRTELQQIRAAYADIYSSAKEDAETLQDARAIGRTLVVFTDNHGEFMVAANGDFKLTYADCVTNVFAGGKHCKVNDKVGTSSIYATVDYPDFRGKHFALRSNTASVTWTWGGYKEVTIEDGELDQFKYIVFRAKDRDGFCYLPEGVVSLHPVLSAADAHNTVGAYDPVEKVDFLIDSGEGIIVGTSGNTGTINDGKQFAIGVTTYSVLANNPAVTGIKEFTPLDGSTDECQAWIRVSNSLLGILNVLTTAYNDEGNIGFDRIIDFSSTASYTLTFRWSLITWAGQDGISPTNALQGTVGADSNNIFDQVTAVYGWNQSSQTWLGFFPAGVSVPGANDLTALVYGSAYWIAIKGPDPVTWTIATDID